MKKITAFLIIFAISLIIFNLKASVNFSESIRQFRVVPTIHTEIIDQVYQDDQYGFEFNYPIRWKKDFNNHLEIKELKTNGDITNTIQQDLYGKDRDLSPDTTLISGKKVFVFTTFAGTGEHKIIGLSLNPKTTLRITLSDDFTSRYVSIDDIMATFKFTNSR